MSSLDGHSLPNGFFDREQKKDYPGYRQLLGLAARTSYDPVNLRAKGFVYLAPETGPDRPISSTLVSKPWSDFKTGALQYALAHEVGHTFGLQDDFYGGQDLMGASFVEDVTSVHGLKSGFDRSLIHSFVNGGTPDLPTSGWTAIPMPGVIPKNLAKFLGSTTEVAVFKVVPREGVFDLYQIAPSSTAEVRVGTFDFSQRRARSLETTPLVKLWLTDKQNVVEDCPWINQYFVFYNKVKSATVDGIVYRTLEGEVRQLFGKYTYSSFPQLGAKMGDRYVFNIFADFDWKKSSSKVGP